MLNEIKTIYDSYKKTAKNMDSDDKNIDLFYSAVIAFLYKFESDTLHELHNETKRFFKRRLNRSERGEYSVIISRCHTCRRLMDFLNSAGAIYKKRSGISAEDNLCFKKVVSSAGAQKQRKYQQTREPFYVKGDRK